MQIWQVLVHWCGVAVFFFFWHETEGYFTKKPGFIANKLTWSVLIKSEELGRIRANNVACWASQLVNVEKPVGIRKGVKFQKGVVVGEHECRIFYRDRGLTKKAVDHIINVKGGTLSVDYLKKKVEWFTTEMGLSDEVVNSMIYRHPKILGYSVKNNLRPTVQWFINERGLSHLDVQKVILRNPNILGLGRKKLVGKISWFTQERGLSDKQVNEMVVKYPHVLSLSIENNIIPKLAWYEETMGVSRREVNQRVLNRSPSRLSLSLEKRMIPRTERFLAVAKSQVPNFEKHKLSWAVLDVIARTTEADFEEWLKSFDFKEH
mmetsp:Transcript_11469/g.18371  ORF Transcript_11469/g.18371 Transcript_11469/m.18371 type:complete len:320 (+) Transcript_11469:131-1090(+)